MKVKINPSTLFDREGYIPLREYLDEIRSMQMYGPWKIPLGTGDRFHLFLLNIVSHVSWFKDNLYILHKSFASPAYSIILSYLKKYDFFDSVSLRPLFSGGGHAYKFFKQYDANSPSKFIESQGTDKDKSTALSKAIGELIERTVSGSKDYNKRIIISSVEEMIRKGVPFFYPPTYHRYLDIQKRVYPHLEPNKQRKVAWVEGKNLITGEVTYLPRSLTLWFDGKRLYKETFAHSTTSGSAGFFDKTSATLYGLLEIVQRDAFFVHWLTKIAPNIIDKRTLPQELQDIIYDIESYGPKLYVLDVTTLGIPSVVVFAVNVLSKSSLVTLTASTRTTFFEAINDALREMRLGTGVFHYDGEIVHTITEESFEPFVSTLDRKERMYFWKEAHQIKKLGWFYSGEIVSYYDLQKNDICKSKDVNDQLRTCIDILISRGKDYWPIVYYPKNPIQDKVGFYVAQVFIPKAFPLFMVEFVGTFDSDRLSEFALAKGKKEWKLNSDPHMFC